MTKIQRIKNFIIENKPTRKEIITFIVVELNGLCTYNEYDHRDWSDYYSTNFTKWKYNEQIRKDDKGRFFITKEGLKCTKGLYSIPDSVIIKRLKRRTEYQAETIKDLRNRLCRAEKEPNNPKVLYDVNNVLPSVFLNNVFKTTEQRDAEFILQTIKKLVE